MRSLYWFRKKQLLIRDETVKRIAVNFLEKARNNIITMELLNKAQDHRKILALPEDYDPQEWVVIAAYYAMYLAALSVLAKVSYRSKNHSATSLALEQLFVKKKLLERKYLGSLEKVKLKREELEELDKAKDKREIAQYSPTKRTTRRIAEETKQEAHQFVDRMEDLFEALQ